MPHVSRNKLDARTEQKLVQTLELVLKKITADSQMHDFLQALLTPTERLMLAKRIAIIVLLKAGLSESDVASTLHVTRVTVSRTQYFYEARGKGYEMALEKLKDEKLLEDLRQLLLNSAGHSFSD